MEVCNLPRGKGKTTYLIYRSHVTNYPILCMNNMQVDFIKQTAKEFGINIPDPISITYFTGNEGRGKAKPNHVLVDEALYVLQQLLGISIDTATLTERERMDLT